MSRRNTPPNTQAQTKAPRPQPNHKQPKTPNTRVQAPIPAPPQTEGSGQAASPNPRTNRHPSQNPDIPTTGATAQGKADRHRRPRNLASGTILETLAEPPPLPSVHDKASPPRQRTRLWIPKPIGTDRSNPHPTSQRRRQWKATTVNRSAEKTSRASQVVNAARPRRPKRKPGELVRRMRQVEHPKQRRWSGVVPPV